MSTFPQFQNTVNHSSISKYCQLLNSLLVWSDLKFIGDGESTFPFNIASGIFIHLRFLWIVFYHLQITTFTTFVKAELGNEDKWPNMPSSCLHYNQINSIWKLSTKYCLFCIKDGNFFARVALWENKAWHVAFQVFSQSYFRGHSHSRRRDDTSYNINTTNFLDISISLLKKQDNLGGSRSRESWKVDVTRSGEPRRQW